jgi:hypothetical protein
MGEDAKNQRPEQIRFIYQKARHHRTFHADGAWAGITPQLEVQFAFFNDLRPMPDEVTHAVTEEGALGVEIGRQHDPQNIIRETNVTVVMNTAALRNTIELLTNMANQIEEAVEAQNAPTAEAEPKV